jgi:hypothetical protein
MITRSPHLVKNDTPNYCCESPDSDLEMLWMAKLGILPADTEFDEAWLSVGAVFRIPFIRERCRAKAVAAGKHPSYAVLYEDEVLAELTEKEIEGLRKYVRDHPEV